MGELLNNFSALISNNVWLALIMSLVAGVVSSFSPCVLSSLPLIVGYIENYGNGDRKSALKYSIVFSLGVAFTFTAIGAVTAAVGSFLTGAGKWWYMVLSAIMLLSGLQLLGVINIGNKKNTCGPTGKIRGITGAFFLGILGGALSSPCATPVMAAILTFVASKGNILLGVLMLLLYSVGHSTLIVLSGVSVGFVESLGSSGRTVAAGRLLKYVLGIIILILGLYLFSLGI
jgi:cytochrome c-type biogenesis protein